MRAIFNWLRSIPRPVAWIIVIGGVLFLMAFAVVASATAWEFTNSPEFCGETCHTMPPEYTAYQVSPHARVDCVDCHLGQESFREAVPAKAREVTHVTNALFNTYEPPIYVKSLRPARDTCEQCHNPDKFSFDTFVTVNRYDDDVENSETSTYLTFKTGGGTREQGLGRGIHWHVENEVWYYTDDPLKQTIPYIKEIGPDGEVVEYFDLEAGLPPDFGETVADELRRMDCIDCHNRVSHLFASPDQAMDDALSRGVISSDIPYIKREGVEVLSREYETAEAGYQAIEDLERWYQENEPEYFAQNQGEIEQAIGAIKDIFDYTVFPNMSIGWQTHPNNGGHLEFPGCFRCHDGKHTSTEGQTIRLECNICHSIPQVVGPGQTPPEVAIEKPPEPQSHKDSNWLAQHRYVFDETCVQCHDVSNPGGTDNSSFCSNSACHATEWKFVGLNAPAIRELSAPPPIPGSGTPRTIPHPVGPDTDCTICHSPDGVRPNPESHASFDETMCTQCHQATLMETAPPGEAEAPQEPAVGEMEEASATPTEVEAEPTEIPEPAATQAPVAGGAPGVPHPVEGREDCLVCHGADGFKPYPPDHEGRASDSCLLCHQAGAAAPEEAPTVEAGATAEPAGSEAQPTPTAAAAATATPAEEESEQEGEEEEEGEEVEQAPGIPHEIAGQEDQCLACHYTGSVKPFPKEHEGLANDQCLLCHQPES